MSFIKEGDALVHRVQLYSEKHWLYHAYIFPFIIVYAIWMYAWLFENFYDLPHEAGMISLAVTFFIQVVIVLACHWSVHVMALVTCTKVSHPNSENATLAKFVPTTNNGSAELKRIHKCKTTGDIWVIFQKLKYVWVEDVKQFQGLEFPIDRKLGFYLHSTGYQDEAALESTRRTFGNNKYVAYFQNTYLPK